MKNIIKLAENDLHNIVKESVKKIIKEIGDTDRGVSALGRVAGRARANDDMVTYGKALGSFRNSKDERYANDDAGEFDYDGWFDYEENWQYYYTSMMKDKDFLEKMIDVYRAYIEGWGYDEMENSFREKFEQ